MKPVVVDPKISFTQLTQELVTVVGDDERALVRDQLVAKLQRKKHYLSDSDKAEFETVTGMNPDKFILKLRTMQLPEIPAWIEKLPDVGQILDRKVSSGPAPIFVSEHEDRFPGTERGYGTAKAPGDYLKEFTDFIKSHADDIPALASRAWTSPQKQWLQKIAAQTKANVIVDRAAIDDPDQLFASEGGGFNRLARIFGGELQQVLDTFNESIWQTAA